MNNEELRVPSCLNFELYQGKGPKVNTDYEKLFGKAASPLLVLLDELPENKKELNYNFYMSYLFPGAALFSYLKYRGYSAIGTIQENRIPKECPLLSKQQFSKKNRGYFENAMDFYISGGWTMQLSQCFFLHVVPRK